MSRKQTEAEKHAAFSRKWDVPSQNPLFGGLTPADVARALAGKPLTKKKTASRQPHE